MADILALRAALETLNSQLAAAQQTLQVFQKELESALAGGASPALLMSLREQVNAQAQLVFRITAERDAAQAAYQAAVAADPMQSLDAGLPLLLLPVRIETAYLPDTSGGMDLVVRIYPDDIHVNAHETELTDAELAAGTAYWDAVWGAGSNTARLDAAWKIILGVLKPWRAAWAVEVLTPAVPRPTEETPLSQPQPVPQLPSVPTRPGTFTRAAQTALLPDHWTFVGLRSGQELFNVDGSAIPAALNVSFGPPGTSANSSDLPFDDASRWLVDLDLAIAAGMAVRIPLTGPDLTVDQLFVLGTSSQLGPADAVARLNAALVAHQYTNGLGFLPPGTPTNNTASTRSGWQSAPEPPSPTDFATARATYAPASNQNAALVSRALGIDGTDVLSVAPHGLEDQQSAVSILQQQLWTVTGGKALSLLYWQWDIPAGQSPAAGGWVLNSNPTTAAALAEHCAGWVRSRGTLPVLRISNQPYGLLPASSLTDWVIAADDPTAPLVNWFGIFRQYWMAAAGSVPRIIVGSESDPDATIVNVLSRLPVSESVMLRNDGDPVAQKVADRSFPPTPIPGLPMNSELFYAAPAATAQPLPVPIVSDPADDQQLLFLCRDLFSDSISVLTGALAWQDWANKYQPLFGSDTLPGAPPPDLFGSLIKDSFTDPLVSSPNDQVVVGIVFGALSYQENKNDPTYQQQIQQLLPKAQAFLAAFEAACSVDPSNYDPFTREIFDIFSHRFDSWVTSLFARRLDQLRVVKPTGIAIGGYGWVENLAFRTDLTPVQKPPAGFSTVFSSPRQKYIHAPSLHHAATAAVLRAGYESHPDPSALAVNLVSSRVRVADWLAAGVRNGQTTGALLGYRFERGLHDAGLDALIAPLRQQFPLPLPTGSDGDVNGSTAKEAIAAGNVLDGLALYRQRAAVLAEYGNQPGVGVLVQDLVNAVDSLGDLLLAESVHHLVGGNPLRSGVAADTIGRGDPVPDRFEVVRTPRSGRPLTWQLGALLPVSWQSSATGWQRNRPRSTVEPHVETWVETILGNASGWQITCNATLGGNPSPVILGLDSLGLAALDVVVESAGNPSLLERRIIDAVSAGQASGTQVSVVSTPTADGSLGFAELLGMGNRLRALLAKSAPIGPQHVLGPDASPVVGFDVGELATRVAALQTSFAAAVSQLSTAAQALTAAVGSDLATLQGAEQTVRSALIAVADHGIGSAYPLAGGSDLTATAAALAGQAAAVLASVQPLVATAPPSAPEATANASAIGTWFAATASYVEGITGKATPVTAAYLLPPDSAYAASFAPGAAPSGSDAVSIMAWLRRIARVRSNAALMHDLFIASETLLGAPPGLTAAQLPFASGEKWVGLPFGDAVVPKARLATVVSTSAPIDPAAEFCGLLFDTWTEQLPGLTSVTTSGYEPAEVTGMAFSVDAPDAYPPQAILLAVIPDQSRGWALDFLFDVVQETLELAKMRTVDLGDLPRLGRVIPALHSSSNTDNLLEQTGVNA
jgi:hypothetical protein